MVTSCSCGQHYSAAQFAALQQKGIQDMEGDGADLLLANCSCGSTIAREVVTVTRSSCHQFREELPVVEAYLSDGRVLMVRYDAEYGARLYEVSATPDDDPVQCCRRETYVPLAALEALDDTAYAATRAWLWAEERQEFDSGEEWS